MSATTIDLAAAIAQEIRETADKIRDARQVSIVTMTDGRTALWVR